VSVPWTADLLVDDMAMKAKAEMLLRMGTRVEADAVEIIPKRTRDAALDRGLTHIRASLVAGCTWHGCAWLLGELTRQKQGPEAAEAAVRGLTVGPSGIDAGKVGGSSGLVVEARGAAWLALARHLYPDWRWADETEAASAAWTGPLLVVGDPVYHVDRCGRGETLVAQRSPGSRAELLADDLKRLCFSGPELEAIARSRLQGKRGGADDVFLTGPGASEEMLQSLELARFSILHFSTHGMAFPDHPWRSALMLSQSQEAIGEISDQSPLQTSAWAMRDGYLDLAEIADLNLDAWLVVLSACETSVGRQRNGEGVESLARAFLLAGAQQVVASQWKVSDQSTAIFMERFYQALGSSDVAGALLEARRALARGGNFTDRLSRWARRSNSYVHPYHWAPFVLIEGAHGPGQPILSPRCRRSGFPLEIEGATGYPLHA